MKQSIRKNATAPRENDPVPSFASEVAWILSTTLELDPKTGTLTESSPILGAIPEFDSIAVVMVISAIEEHFGVTLEDDEMQAEIFETVGSLSRFVEQKLHT